MNLKEKLGLLSATTLLAVGTALPAQAQQPAQTPPAQEAEESDEDVIVVTGSRLRRENLDSPNPTVTVGQEEIADRQIANVGDAIEDIPLVGLGGNARGPQGQNGDSFILPDILDLGSQRTLTLLNGRRIQPTLPGTVFVPGNASGSQVDLSTISPAIIDRVEVVAGTGGAIYGADAVGGVVNIITRDDFEGLEISASTGVTELGDGERYGVNATWGANFLNGRGNITVSADFFEQDIITSSTETASRYLGSGITNPLNGSVRRSDGLSAAQLADALRGGTTTANISAFLPNTADGVSSAFFGPLSLANPLSAPFGVFVTDERFATGIGNGSQVVPTLPIQPGAAGSITLNGQAVPFFAPVSLGSLTSAQVFTALGVAPNLTGLSTAQVNALALSLLQRARPTPYEYFVANPSLNPLLFLGTFGTFTNITSTTAGALSLNSGFYPTIPNPDPLTAGILPRLAVPLGFDAAGNLGAYDFGDYGPGQLGLLGSAFNSGGVDPFARPYNQIQAGTERAAFSMFGHYDITERVRFNTEVSYSKLTFEQIGGPDQQVPGGSTQSGNFAVPIFVGQGAGLVGGNPFLNAQARTQIQNLVAQGFVLPNFDIDPTAGVNNQQVLYLSRNLADVFGGGTPSTTETEGYRVLVGLEGDFEALDRNFYWDANAYYGRSETAAYSIGMKDIEFALAVDVVDGDPGPGVNPVCRQQTLAAPEPISNYNPGITSALTIAPSVGLTPTAAQVAACVPLNLIGGSPSQAAINYVTGIQGSDAINTLEVYSGSLGGELFALPAGWIQVGAQIEHRVEAGEFEPNPTFQQGLTRNALQFTGGGDRQFIEYGYEVNVPLFGNGFTAPLFEELEFGYAWRFVERSQKTQFFPTNGAPTYDDTFNYSLRWKPVEDLSLRGARSRTVRSASLVELFDPGLRAFGQVNAQTNPCVPANIDSGPAPATRRANCVAAVIAYGYATDTATATTFLAGLAPTILTPNRPATAAGNPFLANEESNAYTFGITYEPSYVPRLTLAMDWFSVDLSGTLGLVGGNVVTNACFDSTSFPNSIIGANNPACDGVLFVASGNPTPFGTFAAGTIPSVNPLTGNTPPPAAAFGGQGASPNAPFELASLDFLNLNVGLTQIRAINWEARYNFPLSDVPVFGGLLENAGDMFLRATLYHLQRYDSFSPTLNRAAQEHGFPEFESRVEFRHNVGNFDHTLQWFWTSESVTNIQSTEPLVEQSPAAFNEDFHFFNYYASYDVSDAVTLRLTVNNLTDTEGPRGQYGIGTPFDGGIGREYVLGLTARF